MLWLIMKHSVSANFMAVILLFDNHGEFDISIYKISKIEFWFSMAL